MVNNIQLMPPPSPRQTKNTQIEEGALHFRTLLCIFSCQYSTPFYIFFFVAFVSTSKTLGSHFPFSTLRIHVSTPNISKYPCMVLLFFLFDTPDKTFPSQPKVLRYKHSSIKKEREKKSRGHRLGTSHFFFLFYFIA